ncbi:DGQHR domain-containing protein [Lyngbya confervoides]|uniref:DGQHR domain-containing protein n=1 Tax=Lyngbya confervoides BDU141951 TaxID=1574623 RepID=A0ABD4T124_9CYAN|nr:DNA sulfur modification protein DndB [Lyngbya confervoides]MCM1982002.1 DGQHR domain-containing protein [Lyngbya confervoides BDU141951]
MNKQHEPLTLPALRSHMGDWIYYITSMKMRDIAARVDVAENIHTSKALNELIQRQLQSTHSNKIRNYLLNQPQRFFNTLVIGVYGGSPKWYELDIKNNNFLESEELPQSIDGVLGILSLTGSEDLFAIDGQHRVVGISKALEKNSDLGDEEVSAIFLAHSNSEDGLKRTRRLFTSLNRHAKAVSKMEIIALDEDDTIAIITRELVENHDLFAENKISLTKGKNISPNDTSSFTTIVALYDALDVFLKPPRGWRDFKKSRPEDSVIKTFYSRASDLWNGLIENFVPLEEIRDSNSPVQVTPKYRNSNGGHLLFRPVGLLLIVTTIRQLVDTGWSLDQALKSVSKVPMLLNHEPWSGLLWDSVNHRMITTTENQKVGSKLLFYSVGGKLSDLQTSASELREELAGLLNRSVHEVQLPRYSDL